MHAPPSRSRLCAPLSSDTARLARTLALGQAISLLVAITGVCSSLLAARGVSVPTSQSVINYYLLALCYGGYRLLRARRDSGSGSGGSGVAPATPWWAYAVLALVDVEANYLVVKAYAYTSMTSVMLIDCWSIVVAMALR